MTTTKMNKSVIVILRETLNDTRPSHLRKSTPPQKKNIVYIFKSSVIPSLQEMCHTKMSTDILQRRGNPHRLTDKDAVVITWTMKYYVRIEWFEEITISCWASVYVFNMIHYGNMNWNPLLVHSTSSVVEYCSCTLT